MSGRRKRCVHCAQDDEFDARQAFENLARQQAELAELVARYMSEAGLEREQRTSNAHRMALVATRIVGGVEVAEGGFPECCLIGQENPNGTESWFCTGILVHPRVVLTAAHCQDLTEGLVPNVVALNAVSVSRLGSAEIINIRRVVIHPNFNQMQGHDIAVLILQNNAATQPLSIATSAEVGRASETTLVGFGRDDVNSTRGFGIKRQVTVPVSSIRRRPTDNLNQAEITFGFESDFEFVAGGEGFDSCNGDSGGPAYITVGNRRKLAGLTSRGTSGAATRCGGGGIYTRVDRNLDFVRSVMQTFNLSFN